MFLNEEFLSVWEELSELNEAKADTEKLIAFAGEDLANRFLAIKNRFKAPENDLYYWIKNKTPEELEQRVTDIESTKSITQAKKGIADAGAELVCESEHWKVYHITTFEASQKYGRDTRWCITGVNNWGDRYWKKYTNAGVDFYFLITKGEYDPRGKHSKIAIAVKDGRCEVFDQRDTLIQLSTVPYIEEVKIPGIEKLIDVVKCFDCDKILDDNEIFVGLYDEVYCEECFNETYFKCAKCGQTFYRRDMLEDEHGNIFCTNCLSKDVLLKVGSGFFYQLKSPQINVSGAASNSTILINRLTKHMDYISEGDRDNTNLIILSRETGEIIYEDSNDITISQIIKGFSKAVKDFESEYHI
jgi:DNA-directed RNA polymerase subunit RPC12/RpoP